MTLLASKVSAEVAIFEAIQRSRDSIEYYAKRHLALESPLDIQVLFSYGQLETFDDLDSSGGETTVRFSDDSVFTYHTTAIPEEVRRHIPIVLNRIGDDRFAGFRKFSQAHFSLWEAEEAAKQSCYLLALVYFEAAATCLAVGMEMLGTVGGYRTEVASATGRRAVSKREDQELIPEWQEHCRKARASGQKIERLSDLLDIPGYDPRIMKITPQSLRKWAAEVGIKFKRGRPTES